MVRHAGAFAGLVGEDRQHEEEPKMIYFRVPPTTLQNATIICPNN